MSDIRAALFSIANEAPRKETIEGVPVPVYFKKMQVDDYLAIKAINALPEDEKIKSIPALLARFLCDENGARIYNPDSKDDLAEIAKLDLKTLGNLQGALNNVPN